MTTETLTAEERDAIERYADRMPSAAAEAAWHVVRLYDAALARAEAAELDVLRFREVAYRRGENLSKCFKRALAAESHLAEATAYLRNTTELNTDTMARHVLGILKGERT